MTAIPSPDPSLDIKLDARSLESARLAANADDVTRRNFWVFHDPFQGPFNAGIWFTRGTGGTFELEIGGNSGGNPAAGPGAILDSGALSGNSIQLIDRFEALQRSKGFVAETRFTLADLANVYVEFAVAGTSFNEAAEIIYNPNGLFSLPASPNWYVQTTVGGSITNTLLTGIPVELGVPYRVKIEENSESQTFSVNDEAVALFTADLPSLTAQRPTQCMIQADENVAKRMSVSYVRMRQAY